MKRFCNFILLLIAFCALLTGCSDGEVSNSADKNADGIEFTYYYHGFFIYDTNTQNPIVPDETYVIDTQEEYNDFISAYELTSIYPLDTIDFETECLIYCGRHSAQPSRGWSGKIQSVRVSGDQLDLVEDETVNYDGENEREAVAYQIVGANCEVREVFFLKVASEDLPEGLRTMIYDRQ